MFKSIQSRVMVMVLFVALIPALIIGFLAINSIDIVSSIAKDDFSILGEKTIDDSRNALSNLGEDIIKQKALDVARQMDVYLKYNPESTIKDLKMDKNFKGLAIQPVGETGYTAVTDADTLINYFHVNDKIIDSDLHELADILPGFWSVIGKSQGGNDVHGKYEWIERNGDVREKYMYIATLKNRTADNVLLNVAATTYIDEFSKPADVLGEKIQLNLENLNYKTDASLQSIIITLIGVIFSTLLIAIIISILFAKKFSKPINMITVAADKFTSGLYDEVKLPEAKGSDEISKLSSAMEMLFAGFQKIKKK